MLTMVQTKKNNRGLWVNIWAVVPLGCGSFGCGFPNLFNAARRATHSSSARQIDRLWRAEPWPLLILFLYVFSFGEKTDVYPLKRMYPLLFN